MGRLSRWQMDLGSGCVKRLMSVLRRRLQITLQPGLVRAPARRNINLGRPLGSLDVMNRKSMTFID